MKLTPKTKVELRLRLLKTSIIGAAVLSIIATWVFFIGGLSSSTDTFAAMETIPAGTTVTVSSQPFSNLTSGDTIMVFGMLNINTTYTTHSTNDIVIIVDGSNAELKILGNSSLYLGTNSQIILLNGGTITSVGGCPSSAEIYFGSTLVANCPGSNGATSFADYNNAGGVTTGGAMLPVSWAGTSVEERDDRVYVSWSTASEESNERFEVEFTEDGQNWDRVTTVPSKAPQGNSVSILHYQAIHQPPMTSQHLMYRIKQIDYNGEYDYSKVMLLERQLDDMVKVSTLGEGKINLKVSNSLAAASHVNIYNTNGMKVLDQEMSENQDFSLPGSGVYIIEVASGSRVERIKHMVR